jgi:Cathepsin propeptide inhibitor domain (I29)
MLVPFTVKLNSVMTKILISLSIITMAALACCKPTSKQSEVKVSFLEFIQFNIWRYQHGRSYANSNVTNAAIRNFARNKRIIDAHNVLHENGLKTFSQGIWQHSDKSFEEKSKILFGLIIPATVRAISPNVSEFPEGPASVDYNKQGLVGPVEDQGAFFMTFCQLKNSQSLLN